LSDNLNKKQKSNQNTQPSYQNKTVTHTNEKLTKKNHFNNKEEKLYLDDTEKDGLYSLMGLVNQEQTTSSKFQRNYSILSVEYLFETKYENENKVNIQDEIFNSKLLEEVKKVLDFEGLQRILQEYNKSIKNRIIVSSHTLQEIIKCCLR
jgi:hypothetical protein